MARPLFFCQGCGDDDDDDSDCDVLEIRGYPPKPPRYELFAAEKPELQVAVVREFFSKQDVAALHAVGQDPRVEEINDRDDNLVYKHQVWRIELQLKELHRPIYDRLMAMCRALDADLWKGIEQGDELFPEIEYIVYDVGKLGGPGTIEPHRDNGSQVTMVVLLSPPSDFSGGVNFFEGGEDDSGKALGDRSVRLQMGDAVFFYGDQCSHWITPVSAGRRTILQMELSRGRHQNFFEQLLDWWRGE